MIVCLLCWFSLLEHITQRKAVEEVIFHGDDLEPYLKTSHAGIAHVFDLNAADATTFYRDSPYSWGDLKGSAKSTVCISGRWRRYEGSSRSCTPPMVCSRMSSDIASAQHTHVNFDDPTWVNAMQLCEQEGDAERQVYLTTLVSSCCTLALRLQTHTQSVG